MSAIAGFATIAKCRGTMWCLLTIALPKIDKEFARREGIGYQVLMKRWLDERIRTERDRRRKRAAKPTVPGGS